MKTSEIKKGKSYVATINRKQVIVTVRSKVGQEWEVLNHSSNRLVWVALDKFIRKYEGESQPETTAEVPRMDGNGTVEVQLSEDRPLHWTDGWKAENAEKASKALEGENSLPPTMSTTTGGLEGTDQSVSTVTSQGSSNSTTTDQPVVDSAPVQYSSFSKYAMQQSEQQKKWSYGDGTPHLIIEALAGTGKTTTLVTALQTLKGMQVEINPSPQQRAVWNAVSMSRYHRFCCFVAFNNTIVAELRDRVPVGIDCKTLHSMGYGAVRKAFKLIPEKEVNKDRVANIISELLGKDIKELRREMGVVVNATIDLVGYCKMNLVDPRQDVVASETPDTVGHSDWQDKMEEMAYHYDVDLSGEAKDPTTGHQRPVSNIVAGLVPHVMERCLDVQKDGCVDHNDQIWLPVVLNLPMFQYDLLFVDEAQDLNRCQHAMIKKAGKRLVLCGDPNQAIYGFAGADAESMSRIQKELEGPEGNGRGCRKLKLTVTRRCGKAIVEEAKRYVSDFEAHDDNHEGVVKMLKYPLQPLGRGKGVKLLKDEETYLPHVQPDDMVICRTVAPLVNQYLKFLKTGKKAAILGKKDMGQAIVSLVTRMKATSIPELISRMEKWRDEEILKEQAKKNPSDSHISNLHDRHDTVVFFTEDAESVVEVIARIDEAFTIPVGTPYIRLSSIHKAKGLEAKRVFYLTPAVYPGRNPAKMRAWQAQQEDNLRYVAITRAIKELTYVV